MKFKLLLLFASIYLFSSCDECEDCEPPIDYPFFNLTVFNRTSLDTLQRNRNLTTEEIAVIDGLLQDSENAPIADSLNQTKNELNDQLDQINRAISQVNSNLISIESVNGRETLFDNPNGSDTLDRFQFPLDMANTRSFYEIKIEGKEDLNFLEVEYELSDTILLETITKKAINLRVIDSNYDSVGNFTGCTPINQCSSNQLELYVEI